MDDTTRLTRQAHERARIAATSAKRLAARTDLKCRCCYREFTPQRGGKRGLYCSQKYRVYACRERNGRR
jgi:hypothetical protein